jgi:hypothetical protein
LTSSAKRKIQRNTRRWRDQYRGRLPIYPSGQPDSDTDAPSLFEIWRDRIFYRWFAGYDSFVLSIYSFLPLRVLSGYRALRNRYTAIGEVEASS